ncbi:hypothetical protein BDC45DRAFT_526764 [Circinella umbellata]|nr:hypothetical protein BDC45DRAFT_526764 [Circinella umbellata]
MFRLTTRSFLITKRTFTTSHVIPKNNESIKIDSDCLPTSPTWSINSLLDVNSEQQQKGITDKQFNHLFRLAQLRPPESQKEKENLKHDLDEILRFTEHIQDLETSQVEPLVQLWERNVGMITRKDQINQDKKELKGRTLLKNAEKKHGYFYIVPN